jgi:hypothetical protein
MVCTGHNPELLGLVSRLEQRECVVYRHDLVQRSVGDHDRSRRDASDDIDGPHL